MGSQLEAAAGPGEILAELPVLSRPSAGVTHGGTSTATRSWSRLKELAPQAPSAPLPRVVPIFTVLRGSALVAGISLIALNHSGERAVLGAAVLGALAICLAVLPVHYERGGWLVTLALLFETAVGVAVVELTGLARSPFLLSLGVATLIAGFVVGLRIVAGLAVIAVGAVALPSAVFTEYHQTAGASLEFAIVMVLVGIVGGYSRYLVDDASRVGVDLAERVDHLSKVNDLLLDLHSAAEQVAMPLEVRGAADWAMERLEEAFSPDVVAVFVRDPATEEWSLATARGMTGTRNTTGEPLPLPPPMAVVAGGAGPAFLDDIQHGLSYQSGWGLYCPLRARNELVGLLAVEAEATRAKTLSDTGRIKELAAATALAIDNARWLGRLHTLAVEQERSRLARELHDHIGQSIVYMGFELDRLVEATGEEMVQRDLLALRGDLRTLVEELRDMLVDLRSDVSEDKDVVAVLDAFIERVNRRGRIAVTCSSDVDRRLPLAVEREVWRVAREAVMNAERHARAAHVGVLWLCNASGALLEIADDGTGMPAGAVDGSRFGLVGMRERADAIGAQLEFTSVPGRGTVVRMRVRAA
jgi:signal transduction histidine kinase